MDEQQPIELGRWNNLAAHWGYSADYDVKGLLLTCDGEEIGFYASDDLESFLYRVGSLGAYHLVFCGSAWESIPDLVALSKTYEYWGI